MKVGPSDQTKRRLFTRRALLFGGAQTLIFGGIATRLYHLQVTDHARYSLMARDNAIVQRLMAPERGLITDRTGALLADNQQRWRALFLMASQADPQAIIARFDLLVGLSDTERARIALILAGPPYYEPIVLKHDLDWPRWPGWRFTPSTCPA